MGAFGSGDVDVRRAHSAGLQQYHLYRQCHTANRGMHDAPVVEHHDPLVVAQLRGDTKHARLPAEIQQLEDIVDAELAERSLDRHRYAFARVPSLRAAFAAACSSRCARQTYSDVPPILTTRSQQRIASR
jgi:hypothetical protein